MKILINDLMQFSDLPDDLKSPSLQDRFPNAGTLIVNFIIPSEYSIFDVFSGVLSQVLSVNNGTPFSGTLSQPQTENFSGVLSQPMSVLGADEFDCIGIGGTDATQVIINGDIVVNSTGGGAFKPGLYEIGEIVKANQITISHNGTYMGRIGVGICSELCISPTREPGLYTNIRKRKSTSGAIVAAVGGYGGQVANVDFRYKIDRAIYTEFERAYVTQTMQGFPFFLDMDSEDWLPMDKFYADTDNDLLFQSSINGFKFSKRFKFEEAF